MAGKYIELVGVAGAGKTAIAKMLVEEALRRGVAISPRGVVGRNLQLRVQTLFAIAIIVMSVPGVFALYLLRIRSAYAHTPHVKKIKRNLITRMIVDTAVVRCLQRRSSGYLVNDEGLLGKLVSLSVLTEIAPSKTQTLMEKLLPTPAMLIYVTVPPMVALSREHTRDVELPFFNDMAYDLKETFFRDAVRIYTELSETEASMSMSKQCLSIILAAMVTSLRGRIVSHDALLGSSTQ